MVVMDTVPVNEMERLGFRLAGFRDRPLKKSLQILATIGYKSVELCLEHPELESAKLTPGKIGEVKKWLDHHNLRLSSLSCHAKHDTVLAASEKQKRGLDLAPEFGAHVLVVGTPFSVTDPQGCSTFKALENLLKCAEGTGVIIAAEPEPDTVLHGMYEFSLLASHMVGAPLGLNLDVGHAALTEGDVCEVIREWAPFIAHTHFEDIRKPTHVHLLPGAGHLDLVGAVNTLRENGYTGDLTIDLYDILDAPEEWAARAHQCCQGIFGLISA